MKSFIFLCRIGHCWCFWLAGFVFLTTQLYGASPKRKTQAAGANSKTASKSQTCTPKKFYGARDSGDVVQGPACVGVGYNALRYVGQLIETYTVTAGPALSSGLTPASTLFTFKAAEKLLQTPPTPTPDTLKEMQDAYDAAYRMFYVTREKANADNTAKVAQAVSQVKDLVAGSDQTYATGVASGDTAKGAMAVIAKMNDPVLKSAVQQAVLQKWETSDDIYDALRELELRLQDYTFKHPSPSGDEKAQMDQLKANIATIQTDVAAARSGGSQLAAFNAQLSIITSWNTYLYTSLTEDSFVLKTYVGCGTLLNQNRQIALSLTLTDQLPSFAGTALTPIDSKNTLVTVNCASPFALSAGIEFSFLSTNTFGLVPSGTSGANQFGITETDHSSPLPIAMVNWRIHESPRHQYGLYASFGAAAHVQGSGTGGSSAEYLTGLSLGLFRAIYITPGWHYGKVSSLNGGYKVGDPVPTGVTAVPVTSSYQSGFGLAITFAKPN
jgi:hypothetical protein